jgi:hypothetical protein
MKRFLLAAGAAALAITVPAVADPGKDRGGGRDRGSQAQKADRGGGQKARGQGAERGQKAREQRAERGQKARAQRAERGQKARAQRAERGQKVREQRAERGQKAREQRANRIEKVREQRAERAQKLRSNRGDERALERRADVRERTLERRVARIDGDWDVRRGARGWDEFYNCPRGLAKKPIPCVPPGQANAFVGQSVQRIGDRLALRELPDRLRYAYRDDDDHYYRYANGYVYRIDRDNDVISSLLPLFGLGLTAGQQFPMSYSNYYMPSGLQPFYADSPHTSYRFANGYVYEIDPITGLIEDVDPMLGYGYGYGQMMPNTYSAYNVPYQYRSMYYDTPDSYYRYAPGAIYQVDPSTSLITSVAALLTGGLTLGQQLPAGYNVYNVPYDYRTTYYDTPNDWYRYSNGQIYRVDPTTQLVTAIVASMLT